MTALLDRPAPVPVAARREKRCAISPGVLFAVVLVAYVAGAAVMVLGFDSIMEDALSRLSAASSVWSSADPKLAAIGYVWTPLPALLMVPFTPLRAIWPDLVSTGLLAALLSAVAMAAAVVALHGILTDLRVRPAARWTLTVLFALQPLVLIYATNGMTEALLMLFLLLAMRRLLRWLRSGAATGRPDGTQLVSAGIFLGLGYLARYEAIVAAAAATVLIMVVTALRTPREDRRWASVVVDALLVGLPAVAAFVIWAIVSWAVVGSPFEQFTSIYGNSALVAGGTGGGAQGLLDVGAQLLWLVPLALPVLVAALVVARLRRDPAVLVPVAIFGAVLAFEWLLHLSGNLFGFLRYQIMLVPLTAVLLGILLAAAPVGRSLRTVGATVLAIVVLGSAAVSSGALVLTQPVLASQEYLRVVPVVDTLRGVPHDNGANGMWADDRALAALLDDRDLPPGSVLADTGSAFALVAASRNPEQFVITSDDGFAAALADPPGRGIRYVLRNERGGVDTVRATWPDLGTPTGPTWATKVAEYPGAGKWSYAWTLWAVSDRL